MQENETKEIKISGISGSPGICIGKAYLVDKEGVDIVEKYSIPKDRLKKEVSRFKTAVNNAKKELISIIERIPEDFKQHAFILETHLILLKDKMLYRKTIDTIENGQINAEWALKQVVSDVKAMFRDIEDEYLAGRIADIIQVADRIMLNLMGGKSEDLGSIDKKVILVARDLSPADTSQIKLEKIMGFVTDLGGKASHTSIIARALGIPSVSGLDKASRVIKNDDFIIVDGTSGIVFVNPSEETLLLYEERKQKYEAYKTEISQTIDFPAVTSDGMELTLMGNIELANEVPSINQYGADGIGLFRTEFSYLSRDDFPDEEELFEQYKYIVEQVAPNPVVIRTLDINGDKALSYDSSQNEENPALGLRAIRFCLKRKEVFNTQLRAILRASAYGNLKILFPMISSYEEISEAKALLKEAGEQLKKEGLKYSDAIEIGIMIEIPSAVLVADQIAEIVDYFSIGTNDLVQYTLAIDRGNKDVAHLFNVLHPAVLKMIKRVVEVSREKNVKVSMCGEMAGDPVNVPVLLGLGLNELSMRPQTIPEVKSIIRALSKEECELFMKDVEKMKTTTEIEALLQEKFGNILSKGYTE